MCGRRSVRSNNAFIKIEFAAGKVDAPKESRSPIFVALERGLNVSMEANIQPTVIESQI